MLPQSNDIEQPVLGCDVSAKTITVFDSQNQVVRDIPNTARSISAYLRQFPGHIIACEVTGGYEAKLTHIAHQQGRIIYRVHPNRIAAFIQARGQNAKTDPLDARSIADFIRRHSDSLRPFSPPSQQSQALIQLTRRRDELVRMRVAETNRLKAPGYAACRASVRAVIRTLAAQVKKIEAQIAALIAKDETLIRRTNILRGLKGIGPVTAHSLAALLPELGTLTGKQIAALAGLAPFARQSGTKDGCRRTGRGRTDIKRLMFMAALSASRSNPIIKTFYQRLIKNGKKPMVALIAAARKLLVIANAKLRDAEYLKQS